MDSGDCEIVYSIDVEKVYFGVSVAAEFFSMISDCLAAFILYQKCSGGHDSDYQLHAL